VRISTCHLAILAFLFGGAATLAQEPAGPVRAVACAPTDPDTGAVLSGGAIHLTRDGGATWSRILLGEVFSFDETDQAAETVDLEPDWENAAWYDEEQYHEDVDSEREDDAEEEAADEDPAASGVLLAAADDGRFAALRGRALILGGPRAGALREIDLPSGVRGMRFDAGGDLWIAAEDRIVRVDPRGGTREIRAAVAGAPARGPGGGVLVPTMDAVLLAGGADADADASPVEIASLPVAGERAVAWDPNSPSLLLLAARGRLVRLSLADGRAGDAGRILAAVDRLLPDGDGGISARRDDGVWYRGGIAGWRRTDARDIDVDARGRRWIASDLGIGAPGGDRPIPRPREPERRPLAVPLEPVDEVGPPPCEPVLLFPVPRVGLFLGIGHRSRRTTVLPDESEQLTRRAGVRAGLSLTGDFGPPRRSACLPRFEDWAKRQELRRRGLAALSRSHALAAGGLAGASSLAETARLQLETERLAELIRLMTGHAP